MWVNEQQGDPENTHTVHLPLYKWRNKWLYVKISVLYICNVSPYSPLVSRLEVWVWNHGLYAVAGASVWFSSFRLQSKNIHIRINKHLTLALGVGECTSDVCGRVCMHVWWPV